MLKGAFVFMGIAAGAPEICSQKVMKLIGKEAGG